MALKLKLVQRVPVIVDQVISIKPFAARDKKTLRQCCDYARDIALIENNGVDPNCNPFWGESIVFNQNSIAGDDADAQCRRTLNAVKVGES